MSFTMIPFPASFYPDDIRIQRVVWVKKQGQNVATYPDEPEPTEKASVQSKDVRSVNPETGRVTVRTIHTVRTNDNRNLVSMDRIIWTDKSSTVHTLVCQGPSTAKGIGDIQYKTDCVEQA